ncbi:sugar ABC transporter ATP-binding protein [Amycolatopsis panacis]|uniref:sugar ABC transporter ATP-binding protein n=1 Tax=Amycolatopsis panacis TaxID=2340917 RepID=UPI0013147AC5|nr:sugar ABC transporter ATP-binding protein [Amycolatopsis panacis]
MKALDDVDLDLLPGEIHGLLGQNGSGKSTLIKVLGGFHASDRGTVELSGRRVKTPLAQVADHGIAIIHQDLGLVGSMSVIENIGVSDAYGGRRARPIDWKRLKADVLRIFRRLGTRIDPDARVDTLNPSDHSIVAVARALWLLSLRATQHIFVLDEPTAYLGPAESGRLLDVMRAVAADGAAVLFVSHKLNEVLSVTDRCTVLRDGRVVTTRPTEGLSAAEMVTLQLGRPIDDFYPPRAAEPDGSVRLVAEGVSGAGVDDVSLSLRAGEVLGITGLVGMGQDPLAEMLAGARPVAAGTVRGPDGGVLRGGIRAAMGAGVAFVPVDRKRQGLWLAARGRENLTLPTLRARRAWTPISASAERSAARKAFERVGVRPVAPDMPVGSLSGGNQQKVLMAKWLEFKPRVLILHEPTQGVDAAAKREILALVNASAEAGAAVIICSTDYEQLAATCHRVVTMRDGRVVAEQSQPLTERDVLLSCQGATPHGGLAGSSEIEGRA